MNITRNRLVVGVLVAVGAIASIAFGAQSQAAQERDCSSNSVIPCGVSSASDLRNKYNNGASPTVHDLTSMNGKKMHVSHSELAALYGSFGWSSSDINNSTIKRGYVYPNGQVKVDGTVVATNARSLGRWKTNSAGSGKAYKVGKRTYYIGTTAQRMSHKHAVYVMFDNNGQFIGAIEEACANAIPATPVKPKKPVYKCDSLKATGVKEKDGSVLKYNYVTKATAKNGAKVSSYSYNFGDGKTAKTGAKTSHTYSKSGTYTTTVTVHFTVKANKFAKTRSTSDTCKVTVKPHKVVAPKPVYSCDSLTSKEISKNTYEFHVATTAKNGATLSKVTFDFGDGNSSTGNGHQSATHTYKKAGTYKIKATATFKVNGSYKTVTSTHCQTSVKVCPPPVVKKIKVCRLSDYTIVTINEKDFDSKKYSKDLSDCEKVKVCDTTTNTIVEVSKKEAEDSRYTTNLDECKMVKVCDTTTNEIVTVTKEEAKDSKYTSDLTQCQQVEVCDTTTGKIVKVYPKEIDNERYTTDLTKCAPKPVTPTPPEQPTPPELPHTGTSDVLASLVGAGSLIAALSYYIASRRALG